MFGFGKKSETKPEKSGQTSTVAPKQSVIVPPMTSLPAVKPPQQEVNKPKGVMNGKHQHMPRLPDLEYAILLGEKQLAALKRVWRKQNPGVIPPWSRAKVDRPPTVTPAKVPEKTVVQKAN